MAAFVMAFGIATSIIALQMGFRGIDTARSNTLASQIMQSEIERLRLMAWGSTSDPSGSSIMSMPASETVDISSMFTANAAITAKFSVTRAVATNGSHSDMKDITITVSWRGYDGKSHTRTFTTIYAKNGLYDYYYTLAKQ